MGKLAEPLSKLKHCNETKLTGLKVVRLDKVCQAAAECALPLSTAAKRTSFHCPLQNKPNFKQSFRCHKFYLQLAGQSKRDPSKYGVVEVPFDSNLVRRSKPARKRQIPQGALSVNPRTCSKGGRRRSEFQDKRIR